VAALQKPPGDSEVRSYRDTVTGDTETTLTLILEDPKRKPLPINLVFTVVTKARAKTGEAPQVYLNFYMGRYVGRLEPKPPHLLFLLDPKTEDEAKLEASVTSKGPLIGRIETVQMPFDLKSLTALGRAKVITGHLFGIEFELTAKQVAALRDFPKRLPQ
jgi:hypothetical protein